MKPSAIVPLLLGLILAGCSAQPGPDAAISAANPVVETPIQTGPIGGAEQPSVNTGTPDTPTAFVPVVDNTYLPLEPGTYWVYEGDDEGQHRRDEVRVLDEPEMIDGTQCAAVRQNVFLDGELAEVTTEWFAQDAQGNVWKFGEHSAELDNGRFELTADSWQAGSNGEEPWLMIPAAPRVGDILIEGRADGDKLEVLRLGAVAFVPAGVFEECLEMLENADDPDDTDIILYAPEVGLVKETSTSGSIVLIDTGKDG